MSVLVEHQGAPDRTQSFRALDRANMIRTRRKELKHALRSGARGVEDVLAEPEWWLLSMPVFEVLGLVPRLGPVRVNKALRRADVWPLREVGQLTLRQRGRLLAEIGKERRP